MCILSWHEKLVSILINVILSYNSLFVEFYSGFCLDENIVDYEENRTRFAKKGKGVIFRTAVAEMDDLVKNQMVNCHQLASFILLKYNFFQKTLPDTLVKSTENHVTIKRERDAVVKTEADIDETPFITESVAISPIVFSSLTVIKKEPGIANSSINNSAETPNMSIFRLEKKIGDLQSEKDRVIGELLKVKSENQDLRLQLQKQIRRSNDPNSSISDLKRELADLRQKVKKLEAERKDAKIKNERIVLDLRRERNKLSAQVKQLELAANQSIVAAQSEQNEVELVSDSKSDESDYEVERILAHKMVKGIRKFKIRWKKFSSNHDSWITEPNLNCPKLLKQYWNTVGKR